MSKEVRECNGGQFTFNEWMVKVDEVLEKNIELDSRCLVDIGYWDIWDAEGEPCEAAQEAVEAEWGNSAPMIPEYVALHEVD